MSAADRRSITACLLLVFLSACSTFKFPWEDSSPTRSLAEAPFAKAPRCIEEPLEYSSDDPESTVRERISDLTDDEVVVRLVFSEALASRCVELNPTLASDELTEAIAWTIYNRIRAGKSEYGEGERGVVLKKAQFRSTFGAGGSALWLHGALVRVPVRDSSRSDSGAHGR